MANETKAELLNSSAAIAKALSNPHRLHILELLAQHPRSVEVLSKMTDLNFANCSRHLQILRRSDLIISRRQGKNVIYNLANLEVIKLISSIQTLSNMNMNNLVSAKAEYIKERESMDIISRDELITRMKNAEAILIDTRPNDEFEAGHIDGAVNVPIAELPAHMKALPNDKEIVAYCRGAYCLTSHDAVIELRLQGYKARRLREGYPEWTVAEG